MKSSQKSALDKKLELNEINMLRQKATDLTLQKPEKAAKILESWIHGKASINQKSISKKKVA